MNLKRSLPQRPWTQKHLQELIDRVNEKNKKKLSEGTKEEKAEAKRQSKAVRATAEVPGQGTGVEQKLSTLGDHNSYSKD